MKLSKLISRSAIALVPPLTLIGCIIVIEEPDPSDGFFDTGDTGGPVTSDSGGPTGGSGSDSGGDTGDGDGDGDTTDTGDDDTDTTQGTTGDDTGDTTESTTTTGPDDTGDDTGETTADDTGDTTESTTTTGDPAGDGDGDMDPDCPPGSFGCPCDMGECDEGLICKDNEVCTLDDGGGDGDGDGGDGDGDGDSGTGGEGFEIWEPEGCEDPGLLIELFEIEGQYCAQPCVQDADCPAGPLGTQPACAVVEDVDPVWCVLICDPMVGGCPEGASCQEVPQQEDIGVCTYPA